MKRKLSRRQFIKWGFGATAAAAIAGGSYAIWGERFNYETKKVELPCKRLPSSLDGLRVAHISDTHLGFFYNLDQLKPVVEKLNALEPDLICFTGDLFDHIVENAKECSALLRTLQAPLGKWACLGNHDYEAKVRAVKSVLTEGGFRVLQNEHERIRAGAGGDFLTIAGLDDSLVGRPNMKATLHNMDSQAFTILLSHESGVADQALEYPIDLVLSGHSHGGQVRIPLVGAVFVPQMGDTYIMGHYMLQRDQSPPLHVYVNRGIGTTHLPIRFLCRPEITLITLRSTL
ncbi:metallophosphoesterase [Paenibacillus sp. N1-5-1-14]|uniref:metallophosphoesterase n=1 Tax=Paenibacillus radicibacter TaxID=2972488 RepID=UPI0021590680|nr:metallophosphoesterase [Paenibacillus radicibacter]MCR8643888.1 metallophosphoesterase [Paenibacillus radicibacter]